MCFKLLYRKSRSILLDYSSINLDSTRDERQMSIKLSAKSLANKSILAYYQVGTIEENLRLLSYLEGVDPANQYSVTIWYKGQLSDQQGRNSLAFSMWL